jgi:hypothetical protein
VTGNRKLEALGTWDITPSTLAFANKPPITPYKPGASSFAPGNTKAIHFSTINHSQQPIQLRFRPPTSTTAHDYETSMSPLSYVREPPELFSITPLSDLTGNAFSHTNSHLAHALGPLPRHANASVTGPLSQRLLELRFHSLTTFLPFYHLLFTTPPFYHLFFTTPYQFLIAPLTV